MPKRHFIIYCDESTERGQYFSHIYGGVLIDGPHREAIEKVLNEKKTSLNLYKELKWTYITKNYEQKYIEFIDKYLDLIEENIIKCRIMFTQNIHVAGYLDDYQIDNQYFLLYYQLIKHAFGLRHCNPEKLDDINVTLYLDDIPDTKKKFEEFKNYLNALCHYPVFTNARIMIPHDEITDVRSHEHVIMQGLDIILGAMQFRLNDLHLKKPEGSRTRGNRTRAKERVYKHINKRIRSIYPGFNIGTSTGTPNGPSDRWEQPYRHWRFVPNDHQLDLSRGKKNRR